MKPSGCGMTVGELVAMLQTMPQDAPVIYRCCSDWSELEADDIRIRNVDGKRDIIWRPANGYSDFYEQWMITHPQDYSSREAKKQLDDPQSKFRVVVTFPGN